MIIYHLPVEIVKPEKAHIAQGQAISKVSLKLWHRRLGHISEDTIQRMVLRPVPPEMERPLGAGRLGLSHWAGPSVTGSAGWSQKWYGGIIVDILAKESKFP